MSLASIVAVVLFGISSTSAKPDKALGMTTRQRDTKTYRSSQAISDKPNVIFVLADDLGWGNVGYHNHENPEVVTPNIDYLVKHGLELNRHYVDAE
eukprot:CAMPEP_0202712544 /NCGR_PEP_ID=MMETSP1385-20130828/42623_1 /ASSEMBLY_ACC=CAM_ASM_000861 /TAXON_ID=933848 /ORGANISM="Elphidium margaritaceum" /LENGTH=95 /DNA_ID=CAMNT_0049372615 /DNA_START=44 /DNA_END=328 /DNA_ORIENTATION=+